MDKFKIAAVSSEIASLTLFKSPKSKNLKPFTSVLNGSSLEGPPAANAPKVLPWNEPSKLII